jgi:hypothetical protein
MNTPPATIEEADEIIFCLQEQYLSDRTEAEKDAILELIADYKLARLHLKIKLEAVEVAE